MPLVPESCSHHHPLSNRPVTCKFPLKTQSTLSTGSGLQGRPTRHLCPGAGPRSPHTRQEPRLSQQGGRLRGRGLDLERKGTWDPPYLPSKSAAACR